MLFGTRHTLSSFENIQLHIHGQPIERVSSFKYLGVKVDPLLTFDSHVAYVQSKTIAKIKLLGRARAFLSQDLCISLYKSLVLPMFDFNDYIFDCITSKNAFTLQKLQNAALRSVLRHDRRISVEPMHNEVSMPYLSTRRLKHTATEMYEV